MHIFFEPPIFIYWQYVPGASTKQFHVLLMQALFALKSSETKMTTMALSAEA